MKFSFWFLEVKKLIIDLDDLKNSSLHVYYPLIIAISKRAREIVDDEQQVVGDNSVKEAYDEFKSGKFVIEVPDDEVV